MPALLRALVAPLLIGLAHAMSLSHGPWPWLASTVLAVLLFGAVSAVSFFVPGLFYHRQRTRGERLALTPRL